MYGNDIIRTKIQITHYENATDYLLQSKGATIYQISFQTLREPDKIGTDPPFVSLQTQ